MSPRKILGDDARPRTVRLDDELWAELEALAAAEERSTASLIRHLIKDALRRRKQER